MSEHTAKSLAQIDTLLPLLNALPAGAPRVEIVETAEALRRAIAAFHMEAIRFRMYTVDRLLHDQPAATEARAVFEQLRKNLEEAGFHTRSHIAP